MENKILHAGEIIKIANGIAYVRIVQQAACGECQAKSSCQMVEKKEKVVEVSVDDGLYQVGEEVCLEGNISMGLKAVAYAFIIPLVLLFLSVFLFLAFFDSEGIAVLVSVLVLSLYYLLLYYNRERFSKKFSFSLIKR